MLTNATNVTNVQRVEPDLPQSLKDEHEAVVAGQRLAWSGKTHLLLVHCDPHTPAPVAASFTLKTQPAALEQLQADDA